MHGYIWRFNSRKSKQVAIFPPLSSNLSWTQMSSVEQQNWVWGSSGSRYKIGRYKITREKMKNGNKQKI